MTALGEYIAEADAAPVATRHRSTQPSSHRLGPQITASNVGYQLLQRAGWTEGQGLGSNQQGRAVPLGAYHQQARHGIGNRQADRQQRTLPDTVRKRPADEGDANVPKRQQKQHLPVPHVPEDPQVKRQRHQQVCLLPSAFYLLLLPAFTRLLLLPADLPMFLHASFGKLNL